jgi:hypothetical protein
MLKNRRHRTLLLAAYCVILTTGCSQESQAPISVGTASQTSFKYETQIGIANVSRDKREGCLAIANPSIKPGAKLTLVDQGATHLAYETSMIGEATVVEQLSEDCDNHHMLSQELSKSGPAYYRIQTAEEWNGNGYVFVIVEPLQTVQLNGGNPKAIWMEMARRSLPGMPQ